MRGDKKKNLLDEDSRLHPKNPPEISINTSEIPINTSVHLELPAPLPPAFPAIPAFPFHLSLLKTTSHTPLLAPRGTF